MTLVGSEVTRQVPLPDGLSGFLGAISRGRRFMHDFVALAYVLRPELFVCREVGVEVLCTGRLTDGELGVRRCGG